MEPWLKAFLILLGGLGLFVQPGPFLNDEVGQMVALHSLADGNLLMQPDMPEGFDPIRGWGANAAPRPDEDPQPNAGSTMTNVLALPFLFLLRTFSVFLGPMGAVAVFVSASTFAGLWAWLRDWRIAAAGALSIFAGGLVMNAGEKPLASPYLEAAALQFVSLAFHAFAAALVYDLLRARVERPWVGTGLYAFGTPAMFWGLNLKYHSVSIGLTAMVIWLYQAGHRTSPTRTALAFTVAGLAVWNHPPNGLLILVSLSMMALPSVRLGLVPLAQRFTAAAAGLSVGAVLEFWERSILHAFNAQDRFIPVGPGAGVGEQLASGQGRLRYAVWNDPSGPLDAVVQMVFWVDLETPEVGAALPMLALVPLLVLLPWAYSGGRWRHMGTTLSVWMLVHAAVLLALFGRGVFLNGGGFDLRQASTLWPFLILAVAPAASMVGHGTASLRVAAATLSLPFAIAYLPIFASRTRGVYDVFYMGPVFALLQPLRYIGVILSGALLLVWLVPRTRAWRRHAVSAVIVWSILVQALLQLGPARTREAGVSFPFVAWPTAIAELFVHWFVMGVPG